jgi:hypothetical protein
VCAVFKPSLVSRHTRIRIYKTLARPDHKKNCREEINIINEDILRELLMSQITEFKYQYRKNWKEHVDRMSSDRIPKMILKYQPKGKRNLGRPMERWKYLVL